VPELTSFRLVLTGLRRGRPGRRSQLTIRAAGLVGGTILTVCVALAATAPAATGSVARPAVRAAASAPAAAGPSGVQAKEAAIANAATGRVLWSRDLNTERPMASITKVMTALVVIRAGDLGRRITVPAAVIGYVRAWGASSAGLRPGDVLTASQLLYALILPSGADAAYTLAVAYGPGIGAFVAKMNATARALGLGRTHFSNFDGLPYPTGYSTYSTAYDLIRIGLAVMKSAVFRSIADRRSYRVRPGAGHHAYLWQTTNPLLGVYRGAIGIKTGWTPDAGHCLLFEATRDGRTFIGVNLDSPGVGPVVSGADATRMLNWAFSLPA
jgi:serine-type D-Ala-D-Ala carboxypeptidase (penicillin-binding protein 5/6)